MTLGLGLRQSVALRQSPVLRECIGETSGEIPLYSLHRIKRLLKARPMPVSEQISRLLMGNLIVANQEYKEESGNDWSCLTSNNLVDAFKATDQEIAETIDQINDIPKEYAAAKEKLFIKLHEARRQTVRVVEEWFEVNFQELLYDMNRKIPWAVVLRLRRNLGVWIATAANPFTENIEDMVLDVAAEAGIPAENAEDAWKSMGGTVFTKKGDDAE
jgi:hypothetical protein